MALDVSPDLDALVCYAIVLGVGAIAALFQLSQKLGGFRGAWVMVETWALFGSYALIPVALFWLLDRTSAVHDTSLFGAIVVGVGYQQILSGQLSSIKAPDQISGPWQLFNAWSDRMAARIRDRIQNNSIRFRDSVIAAAVAKPTALDAFKQLAMSGAADLKQLANDLAAAAARSPELGDRGVAERQAGILYDAVRNIDDYRRRLKDRKVISRFAYYWYAQEWRSKIAALTTAIAVVAVATLIVPDVRTEGNQLSYYLWRLSKANATDADRFRTRQHLLSLLAQCPNDGYQRVSRMLKDGNLPLNIVTQSTSLLIESVGASSGCIAQIPSVLVPSLWNANPDARERIEDALVYMSKQQNLTLPPELDSWHPSAEDSAETIDSRIKAWQVVLKTGRGLQKRP
jgi:hypothetical protein